jgi:hypothetical protein
MPTPATAAQPSGTLNVLETALDQNHDVKARVEACAEDLAAASDLAKVHIAQGSSKLAAAQVLQDNKAIELKVQGCVVDLQQVSDNLAHAVHDVKEVERALSRSHSALAESETALAASRDAERIASQRAMHDQKTGLPNRALFDDRLAAMAPAGCAPVSPAKYPARALSRPLPLCAEAFEDCATRPFGPACCPCVTSTAWWPPLSHSLVYRPEDVAAVLSAAIPVKFRACRPCA